MNTDSKFIRLLRLTIAILFFLILWIPIIQMIHPILPEMKSTENRELAKTPKIRFSLKGLRNYMKQLNMYINDHYGFRNFIIRVNCMIHVNLLHTSPTRDVVLGREGWLYWDNNNYGNNLKDFYGESNFSEAHLDNIIENIIKIDRFCEERGILFKIVLAPNKHTIYPEFLPLNIKNRQGASTRLDQVKNYLIRNKLESVLIDLRPTLVFSKNMEFHPLYYLTDTHWNQLGAFIAYTEIVKNLRLRYPQIRILDIKNYRVVTKENNGLGDLAGFISMSGLLKDMEIVLEPQTPDLAKKIDSGIELGWISIKRYHIEKCNYPKLLMFGDSFLKYLLPYLSESFSDSLYLWPYVIDFSIIKKENPQIVILELAERNLQFLSNPLPMPFEKIQGKS